MSGFFGTWNPGPNGLALSCPPERVRREGDATTAWSGFLPAPRPGVFDPADPWEGHFALARAEPASLLLARDLSGGTDLYYRREGSAVHFSDSLRPLLARVKERRFDADSLAELLFLGPIPGGGRSLFDGIRAVGAGESVVFTRDGETRLPRRTPFLEEDDAATAAGPRELRAALTAAVGRALAGRRAVAVALSGGLDSAVVAALAAEALGAGNVTALSYEFDEPTHPSETAFAAATAKRLGLRHDVVRITRPAQLDAVPRYCWRVADGRMRGPASLQLLLERAAADGHGLVLTGDGVEHVMGLMPYRPYLRRLAADIARTPALATALALPYVPLLKRALPARASWPPPERVAAPVLAVLAREGLLPGAADAYPKALRGRFERAAASALGDASDAPLARKLEAACFRSFTEQRMLWKRVALASAAGTTLAAPALLRGCAELAPRFAAATWSRPEEYSRFLLTEAFAKELAPEVRGRAKIAEQAIAPAAWLPGQLDAVEKATGGFAALRRALAPEEFDAAAQALRYPLAQAALLSRVFLEGEPRSAPPSWEELGA